MWVIIICTKYHYDWLFYLVAIYWVDIFRTFPSLVTWELRHIRISKYYTKLPESTVDLWNARVSNTIQSRNETHQYLEPNSWSTSAKPRRSTLVSRHCPAETRPADWALESPGELWTRQRSNWRFALQPFQTILKPEVPYTVVTFQVTCVSQVKLI